MLRKKMVFIGVISLIILVFVGFVSAEWWSKITGKQLVESRDVSLTVQAAPEIVFITDVSPDRILNGGNLPTKAQKTFDFYVWHSGGFSFLPGPTGPAIDPNLPSLGGNVLLTVKFFGAIYPDDFRISSDNIPTTTCAFLADDPAYDTDTDALSPPDIGVVPVRQYRCTVEMEYYDDYGSSPGNWDVEPYVLDSLGYVEGYDPETGITVQNGVAQPNRDTYFDRLDFSDIVGDNLDYGIVGYADKNIEPIAGIYPLVLQNLGNSLLNPLSVTGFDIPDTDDTDGLDYVSASWFTVDDVASVCTTGVALSDTPPPGPPGDDITIPGLSIPDASDASPTAESDLRVCLTGITIAAPPQDYSTSPAWGNAWDIQIDYA